MTPPDAQIAVEKLRGLTLSGILFGPDHVQLRFTGCHNAFIEINRSFEVGDRDTGEVASLEVSSLVPQRACALLVAARGQTVVRAELQRASLAVQLSGGTHIDVTLHANDFEPIVFSGSHHLTPNELAWHFIIRSQSTG
jgi:hypothetical protein